MADNLSTGIASKRYPGSYSCVDTSPATLPTTCCPPLFHAPMLPTGMAIPDVPVKVIKGQENALFGAGSVAQQMATQAFRCCPDIPLEIVPQANAGTPSIWAGTFTGTATETGSVVVQVCGELVVLPIPSGNTAAVSATDGAAEIDALASVTATAAGGVITITSEQFGELTACKPVRVYDDSELPEGVTFELVLDTAGSGVYDVQPGLDAVSGCCFDFFASPYNDPATLLAYDEYMNFTGWGCGCVTGGHFFFHDKGTFGELCDKYDGVSYRHGSLRACCEEDITPWIALAGEVASNYCAACENPSKSWVGNKLGIRCTDPGKCIDTCWTKEEREALSDKGIGTYKCGADGYVLADDTTMAKDENGDPDPRWGYPQLGLQSMRIVRWLENYQQENLSGTIIVRDANESIQRGAVTDTATVEAIANEIYAELLGRFDGFLVDASEQEVRDIICAFVDSGDPSCFATILNTNFVCTPRRFKNRINPTKGVNFV